MGILRDEDDAFFQVLRVAHDGALIINELWELPPNAVVLRTSE